MNGRAAGIVAIVLAASGLLLPAGCRPSAPTHKPAADVETIPGEPTIRVRLDQAATEITFTAPTKIQVHARQRDGDGRQYLLDTPVTIRRSGHAWIGPWGDRVPRGGDTLVVQPVGPAPLQLNDTAYPGDVHLVPVSSRAEPDRPASLPQPEPDAFDVVNHLGIERYLPGVLERELYANFQPATYLAQAIVARSYAISRIIQHGPDHHYDVESTIASQVYGGQATRPVARRAVADTAGLVLTHDDQIFTAYYSSTCGGVRQSPEDVFDDPHPVPPLQPRETHSWCDISPRYEWGPVRRDRTDLSRRIAAWGHDRNLTISRLGTIVDIRVVRSNRLGRPVRFRLIDDNGRAFELRADSLRHAANYHDSSRNLPAVGEDDIIRSGHFDIAVRDGHVHFTNGRGFGHGVGFCQFGAEGMARAGKDPRQILAENYPGAQVEKAY